MGSTKGAFRQAGERRLAIAVEDHPLDYLAFEGTIPEGEYGGGEVKVADTGTYAPLEWKQERIEVHLHGSRLKGKYVLIRFKNAGEKEWLILHTKE